MNKFTYNIEKLKPGDILFERYYSEDSNIISQITRCHYTHVALYLGGSSCIESTLGIVCASNPAYNVFGHKQDLCVKRLREEYRNSFLINKAAWYARTLVGTAYSIPDAAMVYKKSQRESANYNRQFCSRLVAQSFEYAGIRLAKDPSFCSPAELFNREELEVIDDAVIEISKDKAKERLTGGAILTEQSGIIENLLSQIREITSADIQTIEQIFDFVLQDPTYDKTIASIINDSGYLDIWRKDLENNPWYEDEYQMAEHCNNDMDALEAVISASKWLYLFYSRLKKDFEGLYQGKCLECLKQQVSLYDALFKLTAKRILTAGQVKQRLIDGSDEPSQNQTDSLGIFFTDNLL